MSMGDYHGDEPELDAIITQENREKELEMEDSYEKEIPLSFRPRDLSWLGKCNGNHNWHIFHFVEEGNKNGKPAVAICTECSQLSSGWADEVQ